MINSPSLKPPISVGVSCADTELQLSMAAMKSVAAVKYFIDQLRVVDGIVPDESILSSIEEV